MRAFIALGPAVQRPIVDALEQAGFEAIPMTSSSKAGNLQDNIDSLVSSDLVVVDHDSPPWVLREIHDHGKFAVAYQTIPTIPPAQLVALVDKLETLVSLARDAEFLCQPRPVTDEYVRRLGKLKMKYQKL